MFAMITEASDQDGEVSQFTGLDADGVQGGVDDAGVAVEHPRPGGGRHDQRQQPRHQEQGAQGGGEPEVLVEEDRERQADRVLEDQDTTVKTTVCSRAGAKVGSSRTVAVVVQAR